MTTSARSAFVVASVDRRQQRVRGNGCDVMGVRCVRLAAYRNLKSGAGNATRERAAFVLTARRVCRGDSDVCRLMTRAAYTDRDS